MTGLRDRAWRVLWQARNRGFRTALGHDPTAPALVLSPHLDDAVIDCWSVLTAAHPVAIVTVCAGIPTRDALSAWDALAGATDAVELMRQRRDEDRAALALAGRTPIQLPFLQDDHRSGPPPAFARLDAAIIAHVPAAREVYAPAVLGARHPDHALVRDYALALAAASVPVRLYADAPYAVVYGWPAWVTGGEPDPHLDIDCYWRVAGTDPALVDRARARVTRLSTEQQTAKLAAMRTYRSHFSMLDRGSIGLLSKPLVHGFEVFWNVG